MPTEASGAAADLKRAIIRHAITADVQYVARYVGSTRRLGSPLSGVAALWMAPFMALFIHESARRIDLDFPEVAVGISLSDEVRDIVARSRNALKLFEDTKRGIDGQVDFFRNEVVDPHRDRFIGGIRIGLLRGLGRDLGVFSYEGNPIGNTHSAGFFMGINSRLTLDRRRGPVAVRQTAVAYGEYFGELGAELLPGARSFLDGVDLNVLEIDKDVRSKKYYSAVFNDRATPDLNALLCVFQGLVNLVARVQRLDTEPESRQTIMKLQYLTIYEVVRSLRLLLSARQYPLTNRSRDAAGRVVSLHGVSAYIGAHAAPLRNSLMHYDIDSRIPIDSWREGQLLYGFIEAVLGIPIDEFEEKLQRLVEEVAGVLNGWSTPAS